MTERLFVYGTLAPGKPNEHVLKDLAGEWIPASVNGVLHAKGWGAAMGFPGLVLDPDAEAVSGLLFCSDELAGHWHRLDAFEGEGYQRIVTYATLGNGEQIAAYVYAIKT